MSDQDIQVHPQLAPQTHSPTSADDDLQRKEQGYRLLVEVMQDAIWTADLNLRWTYRSSSIEQLLGLTPEEAAAQNSIFEVLTPASADLAKRTLSDALAAAKQDPQSAKRPHTLELELIRKRDASVWIEIRATLLVDEMDKPVGLHRNHPRHHRPQAH